MNFDLGDKLEDFEALFDANFNLIHHHGKKDNGYQELSYINTNKQNIYLKCGQVGQKQPCLIEYIDPLYGAAELWITSIKDRKGNVVYYNVIGDHLNQIEAIVRKIDDRID